MEVEHFFARSHVPYLQDFSFGEYQYTASDSEISFTDHIGDKGSPIYIALFATVSKSYKIWLHEPYSTGSPPFEHTTTDPMSSLVHLLSISIGPIQQTHELPLARSTELKTCSLLHPLV